MTNCIHGLEQDCCAICERKTVMKNTYFEPQLISKNINNEQYGLVLSNPDKSGLVKVMWLKARNHFERINKEYIDSQYVRQLPIFKQDRLKQDFRNIATYRGSLFMPRGPLTRRETTEIGESNCWACGKGTKLSYDRGSIGCKRCKTYACVCGHCMCDFPGGMGYRGYIPERKHSPFNNETRCEYVKIVMAFSKLN